MLEIEIGVEQIMSVTWWGREASTYCQALVQAIITRRSILGSDGMTKSDCSWSLSALSGLCECLLSAP